MENNDDHSGSRAKFAFGLYSVAAGLLAGSIAAASESSSFASPQTFDIPSQPLDSALTELADRAGLKLLYRADTARQARSHKVAGNYTPQQALDIMLHDTGLSYRLTDDGALTIEKPRTEFSTESLLAAAGEFELVKAEPEEKPWTGPVEQLDMKVLGGVLDGYAVVNASTATKTDTPIMETPVSVQVVPKTVMEDQQVILAKDALKNVSGVLWSGDFSYDGFQLRGFISDGFTTVYRNGLRIRRAQNEVANLDRFEILKGAAGALYGRIEPGGLINLVTKKPADEPHYSLQQQFGSFDLYRTTLEATGPINEDGTLLYHADLAYKNNNTFIDFVDQERIFFSPSITWRPSARTEFNLNLEYQFDESRYYAGIPAFGNRPAQTPNSRYLGFGANSNDEFQTFQKILVGFDWSHRFTDQWTIRQRFHYYNYDYVFNNTWYGSGGVAGDGRSFTRGLYHFPKDENDTFAANIDLTGEFDTFALRHQVLVGFDFFHEKTQAEGFSGVAPAGFRPTIDIFNPVYGSIPRLSHNDLNVFTTARQNWYGVYFQDQITLWDKLHILGGGRYDWTTVRSGFSDSSIDAAKDNVSGVVDQAFSPRVGLVYQPWLWLSLYANYTESLANANTGRSASGRPFDPQTAEQYEAGFKTQLLDGRLTSTVAFYHLTKQNVLTRDENNPGFSIAIGEARSRGIEVDVAGQVTDSLSLIATYALTDSEITKDNSGNQGNRFFNIPSHSGSLWTKYDFHDSSLEGLSVGAGLYLIGQRACDNANTCELAGYGRVDTLAAYKWRVGPTQLTAQLNVNNLLDKNYFESAGYGGRGGLIPGAPRTFTGSIRLEY